VYIVYYNFPNITINSAFGSYLCLAAITFVLLLKPVHRKVSIHTYESPFLFCHVLK